MSGSDLVCIGRQFIAGVATVALSVGVSVGHAATISEVFFADLLSSPTPNAVELDGLETTGASVVDLVVLDATAARAGQVLQVISLPTAGGLVLISDASWPVGLWGEQASPATRLTLEQVGEPAGTTWNFRFSRTLVLFDRQTNLVADRVPLADQQANLNGGVAVDWLTFSRAAPATAWAGEPVHDTEQGYIISRSYDPAGFAGGWLVGTADHLGYLNGALPHYAVTPGRPNSVWVSPEPDAGVLLMGGLALFYTHRRSMMDRHA